MLTDDLDRFVELYTDVFDLGVVFTETTPAFRHAVPRTGPTSWLHPAQVVVIVDDTLRGIHSPRPLDESAQPAQLTR